MYRFCSLIIEDPKQGRVIASSLLIFYRHKKALVSYMTQELSDGLDSQVIPEEKTGTYGLDRGVRVVELLRNP